MDCLLYGMQETNSKEDSLDTNLKLHSWRPSTNCKMWRIGEQTLNLTTHVKEFNEGRKHQKEVLGIQRWGGSSASNSMCLALHTSPTNEAFMYASLLTIGKILSLRRRTPFKSLFLEIRDYEEHGEIESP
jgi:hypothetical protein